MNKKNDTILNDLKTLKKLKDVKAIEEKTEMTSISSFDDENVNNGGLKNHIKKLFNSLFPARCYVCNQKNENFEDSCICDKCKMIYKQYEVNKHFYDEDKKEIGIGIYRYDGVIRYLIQKMKYEKNKKIAYALAEITEDKLREFLKKHHVNYIIPMPIHEKRLKERGFNQSELIAKSLSEKLGIPMRTDLIGRTRYTIPQSKLPNAERKANVEGSFKILDEFEISGKDIILIDDIYTTGSTMEECSKVLTEHNTRKVYFLSISVSNNKLKGECKDEN